MGYVDPDQFRAMVQSRTISDPGVSPLHQILNSAFAPTSAVAVAPPPLPLLPPGAAKPGDTQVTPSESPDLPYADQLRTLIAGQGTAANNAYANATSSIAPGSPLMQNAQEAVNTQMAAQTEQANIAKKIYGQQADLMGQASETMRQQNLQDETADRQHAQELDAMKKRATMAGDIATQAEVKDFWHDKSTGSRVLGVLAQTLAGAANGLAGTPGAPSALDRIIDHDFEVQKSQVAGKKDAAYRAEGALAQLVNTYKDEREGKIAARAAAYKMTQTKLDQLKTQMQGEIEPAKADQMNAQLQQQHDQTLEQLQVDKSKTAAIMSGNAVDAGTKMYAADRAAQAYGVKAEHQLIEIPGLVGKYDARSLTAESRTKLASYSEVFQNLDGYERDLTHDDKAFRAYAGTITGNALNEGAIRKILGTGAALNAAELKAVQSFTLDFLKGQSLASLAPDKRAQFFQGVRRSLARSYGGFIRGTVQNAVFDPHHASFGRANRVLAEEDAAAAAAAPK